MHRQERSHYNSNKKRISESHSKGHNHDSNKFNSKSAMDSAVLEFWKINSYLSNEQRRIILKYRSESKFLKISQPWPTNDRELLTLYMKETHNAKLKEIKTSLDLIIEIEGKEFISDREVLSSDFFKKYRNSYEFSLFLLCPLLHNFYIEFKSNSKNERNASKSFSNRKSKQIYNHNDNNKNKGNRDKDIEREKYNGSGKNRDKEIERSKKSKHLRNGDNSDYNGNDSDKKKTDSKSKLDNDLKSKSNSALKKNTIPQNNEKLNSNFPPIIGPPIISTLKEIIIEGNKFLGENDFKFNIELPQSLLSIEKALRLLRIILKMLEITQNKELTLIYYFKNGEYKVIGDFGEYKNNWGQSTNFHFSIFIVYFQILRNFYIEKDWTIQNIMQGILKRQIQIQNYKPKPIQNEISLPGNIRNELKFDFSKRKPIPIINQAPINMNPIRSVTFSELDYLFKDNMNNNYLSSSDEDSISKENRIQKKVKKNPH